MRKASGGGGGEGGKKGGGGKALEKTSWRRKDERGGEGVRGGNQCWERSWPGWVLLVPQQQDGNNRTGKVEGLK